MVPCALCQKEAKLCKSHVIPEFAYKAAYDDKHRLITFDPYASDRLGYEQKGLRSPLLCQECEQLINERYEKPFYQYWLEGDALAPLADQELLVLEGIDYSAFKLFHLSILLRADASGDANFRDVDLGPHREVIREMVFTSSPGPQYEYPIMCVATEGKKGEIWKAIVGPAHRINQYGARGYYFAFCGCQWWYIVASHMPAELVDPCLTEEGTLPVTKRPLVSMKHYRKYQR